jgi:hypothetical protein
MRRVLIFLALVGVQLAAVVATAQASTVITGTGVNLQVGNLYTSPQYFWLGPTQTSQYYYAGEGAGNIRPNTINGVPLNYMYCVDIHHVIYVPGDYKAQVNQIGYIINDVPASSFADTTAIATTSSPSPGTLNPSTTGGPNVGVQPSSAAVLTNAGAIGYLMVTYAPTATTQNQQLALQAAIWKEVYGSEFVLDANWYNTHGKAEVVTLYNSYLSSIPANTSQYVDDVLWINPYSVTSTTRNGVTTYSYTYRQAQVGYIPAPLPGTFGMALSFLGAVFVGGLGRRFWKAAPLAV